MATSTLGTNANNSIPNALKFLPGYGSGMATADIATIAGNIKDDLGNLHSVVPGAFTDNGLLFIPNRTIAPIKILPGDWVGVTSRGWPILLSADEIANGLWTHNP